MIDTVLNNLIPSSDAAVLLNCNERTLRRYRQRGLLPRHRVKRNVYYSLDDIAKLREIKDTNNKDSRLEKRVVHLENEIRSLKKQVSLLSAVVGFRSNDTDSLTKEQIRLLRKRVSESYRAALSVIDMRNWVDDLSRLGMNAIKQVGADLLQSFIERLRSLCKVFVEKTPEAVEWDRRLQAKLIDFPPSSVQVYLDEV